MIEVEDRVLPDPKGRLNSFWCIHFDEEFQDGRLRCLSVGPTRSDLKRSDDVKAMAAHLVASGAWDPQAEPTYHVADVMPVIELPRQRL